MTVSLRPAGWVDVFRVWQIRNEPSTRAMMLSTLPISLVEHVRWFARAKRSNDVMIMMISAGLRRVGTVRLDVDGGASIETQDDRTVSISIAVAERYRGRRYASDALAIVCARSTERARVFGKIRLIADVKLQNVASILTFVSSGFLGIDGVAPGCARLERICG